MFRRLLIANRGEVAVRIARACRSMGISPVGVCSTADRGASWLERMDEAVCIGGASPRESYLDVARVIQAARQTSCAALHPGWGFLAENSRFAALCEQHGITFIGPSPAVMERMGRKQPAKLAMRAAGLQLIPGTLGLLRDRAEAVARAEEIGYPLILKADAGGGGRGMRICRSADQVAEAFESATAEARGAFGDGGLYIEKYLSGGRHVEVQVLCDRFGKSIHLGERECSIQRNHQKLIEESPSPALSPEERQKLGRAAARAAASIGYVGAGTVEFLLDGSSRPLFIEMNTRLQVEHPVTEEVTGVDVVKQQIAIAANERLTLEQVEVKSSGHAIECRINAEDPAQGFRPTPGVLTAFDIPQDKGTGVIRVDTHLETGQRVPPHYDSLLAKVIAFGKTRDAAIETMVATLKATRIEGVSTTIPVHLAVLGSREFKKGEYDTASLPGWPPKGAEERAAVRAQE